jgi:pimeloyl-ACP methyl ester carboxylesterase
MRDVILAPGLWMPGIAMALLSARLARAGYKTHLFTYRGRSSFDANVALLARHVREMHNGRPAHFVGHSLGGVLVFNMLNAHPQIEAASAVLLGAPVRGCLAGRRLGTARVGRWMMGACGGLWVEHEARWERAAPLGVVAGTLPLGLGRLVGRLPGVSDGVVRLEETDVDGMTARALVPLGHSMLIFSSAVEALVERFLESGKFA